MIQKVYNSRRDFFLSLQSRILHSSPTSNRINQSDCQHSVGRMSIECQSFWYAWNTPRGDGDEVSPNHILGLISCHTRGLHSERRRDVPIRRNVFRYYNDQSVSIELTSSLLLSRMNKNFRDFTKSFFYQLVAGIYTSSTTLPLSSLYQPPLTTM